MQAKYPERSNTIRFWDTVHTEYPVRKFPNTSETVGRLWKKPPEVLKTLKHPVEEIKKYSRDYNTTKQLTRSQSAVDYGAKLPETQRFNKHTSCTANQYLYPPNRVISERPPRCSAHSTTEMMGSYGIPELPATLDTDKDQFKDPRSLRDAATLDSSRTKEITPLDNTHEGYEVYLDPYLTTNRLHHRPYTADQLSRPSVKKDIMTFHTYSQEPWAALEPSRTKAITPLDNTHEGYEVYLDPYLTTNRLHHRPYTADQLSRPSVKKDIMTFHTYSQEPWVRSRKPQIEEWNLPIRLPKSMYDREKFKSDFREIKTHKKQPWVPGSFHTEVRVKFTPLEHNSLIHNYEEDVMVAYERAMADVPNLIPEEVSSIRGAYMTENTHYGSGRPLSSVIQQHKELNKTLERR